VLEFLGLPEDPSATETGIESAIISQLQSFLLEMGHGFSFVARQMRVSTETSHFYLDLVFYHYVLKRFVIIDLCALCRSAFRPLPSVWPAQEAARGVAATSRRQSKKPPQRAGGDARRRRSPDIRLTRDFQSLC